MPKCPRNQSSEVVDPTRGPSPAPRRTPRVTRTYSRRHRGSGNTRSSPINLDSSDEESSCMTVRTYHSMQLFPHFVGHLASFKSCVNDRLHRDLQVELVSLSAHSRYRSGCFSNWRHLRGLVYSSFR